MKYPAIISLFFLVQACQQPATSNTGNGQDFPLDGFTTSAIEGSDAILAQRFNAAGILLEEGTILNGKRDGAWIIYHDKDKQIPKTITNYVAGVRNGTYTEYTALGSLTMLRQYLNNELHGVEIDYRNGRLEKVSEYKHGKLDGVQKSYYQRSDQVQIEAHFKEGIQHGKYLYYAEDGSILMEYEYENGEKVSGTTVEYD